MTKLHERKRGFFFCVDVELIPVRLRWVPVMRDMQQAFFFSLLVLVIAAGLM